MSVYPAFLAALKPAGTFNPRWVYIRSSSMPRVIDEGQSITFSVRCDNAIPGARVQLYMTGGNSLGSSSNWVHNWTTLVRQAFEAVGCTVQADTKSTVPPIEGTISWTIITTDKYVPGTVVTLTNTVRKNRRDNAPNYGDIRGGAGSFQVLLKAVTAPALTDGRTAAEAYGTRASQGSGFFDVRDTSRRPLGYPTIRIKSTDALGNSAPAMLTEGDTFYITIETTNMIPGTKLKVMAANVAQNQVTPPVRTALRRAALAAGCECEVIPYTAETAKQWFNGGTVTFTEDYQDSNPITFPLQVTINDDEDGTRQFDIVAQIVAEGDASGFETVTNRGDYSSTATYNNGDFVKILDTGRVFIMVDTTPVKGVSPPTDETTLENESWREFFPIQALGLSNSKQFKDLPATFWEISTVNGKTSTLTTPDGRETLGNKYKLAFPGALSVESKILLVSENTPPGFIEALTEAMPADKTIPAVYEPREVTMTWDNPNWERVTVVTENSGEGRITHRITKQELIDQGFVATDRYEGPLSAYDPMWTSVSVPGVGTTTFMTRGEIENLGYSASTTRYGSVSYTDPNYQEVRIYSGKELGEIKATRAEVEQEGNNPTDKLDIVARDEFWWKYAKIYSGRKRLEIVVDQHNINLLGYQTLAQWYLGEFVNKDDYFFSAPGERTYYTEENPRYTVYASHFRPPGDGPSLYAWYVRNLVFTKDFYYSAPNTKVYYTDTTPSRMKVYGNRSVVGTEQESSAYSWYKVNFIDKKATYEDSSGAIKTHTDPPKWTFYGTISTAGKPESSLAFPWYKKNFMDTPSYWYDPNDAYKRKLHGKPIAWTFYGMGLVKVKDSYVQRGPVAVTNVERGKLDLVDNKVKDFIYIKSNITTANFDDEFADLRDRFIAFDVYDVPANAGAHVLQLRRVDTTSSFIPIPDAICFNPPPAIPDEPENIYGYNAPGGEFGDMYNQFTGLRSPYRSKGYRYPAQPENSNPLLRYRSIDYHWRKGSRILRLPIKWGRIQNDLFGPLYYGDDGPFTSSSRHDMRRIIDIVNYWTDKGGRVLLDLHNYMGYSFGPELDESGNFVYKTNPDGTLQLKEDDEDGKKMKPVVSLISDNVRYDSTRNLTVEALSDVWLKLHAVFGNNKKVWYGIMNEPSGGGATPPRTAKNMQAVLNALRVAGCTNKILIAGSGYSNCKAWVSNGNAAAFDDFYDPLDNYAFEPHNYIDTDQSGTKAVCVIQTPTSNQLVAFTNWCRAKGARGFMGEFAGGDPAIAGSEQCAKSVPVTYQYMVDNKDVWLGWTTWAGNFPTDRVYMFNLEPVNYEDGFETGSMKMLMPFLAEQRGEVAPSP